jgi:Uma2 family endonuclease
MATPRPSRLATAADLAAWPSERAEVVAGTIVEKAGPSYEHGDAQSALSAALRGPFHRRSGGSGGPGGWWFATEVEIELEEHEVYLPDIAGWRRERVPERPSGRALRIRPDWVCEILSPSNADHDLVRKLRVYQRCAVPHYWVVDPERRVLIVHRWTEAGYVVALTATAGETVRAEPFDAIELAVGVLFGEEPA